MGWSEKYKRSIDCDNPKGFSQRAHCQGRKKKISEQMKPYKTVEQIAKKHRLEVSFIEKQLEMGEPIEHEHTKNHELAREIALQHLDEIPDYYTRLKKMEAQAKRHHKKFKDMKESLSEGRRDNKRAGDPGYSLRDWFKGGGWVQVAGKYKGKPCAKQPGQKTKPFCRDADDAAAMSTAEKKRRTAKKRREDPNPERRGKAKMVNASYQPEGQQLNELWGKAALAAGATLIPYLMSKFKPAVDKAIDAPATGSGTLPDNLKQRRDATNKAINQTNSFNPEGQSLVENACPVCGYDPCQCLEGSIQEKKDACYHKVKSRYKVWPSAYASGALVKCRKVGADSWGTKSESTEALAYDWDGPIYENEKRYCPKCMKMENMNDCKYGPRYWSMFSLPLEPSNSMKYSIAQVHPANEEKDHEYSMARSELSTIIDAARRLKKKMKGEGSIEAWVQSKITKAADYIDTAADYIESGEHKVDESIIVQDSDGNDSVEFIDIIKPEPLKATQGLGNKLIGEASKKCWPGYEKKGTQKLFGKTYNRCVKKEQFSNWREELAEDWQKVNRQDKTDGLSQAAVDAYRRENPGSKLQTAVTEKKPKGKRAKRRENFCRRMKGMKSKLTSAKTARDPDSRINKALRRWNCN